MTITLVQSANSDADDIVRIEAAIRAAPTKSTVQIAREDRGLSREALARRAGVNLGDIVSVESGTPPDTLLLASIAYSLEVPASLLRR